MLKRVVAASKGESHDGSTAGSQTQTLPPISETGASERRPSVGNQPPKAPMGPIRGPSLMGIFASKRLAKQLSSRVLNKRHGSIFGSSRISQTLLQKEPTYRMEPHTKFDSSKVADCIKSVLDDKLQRFPYNPKFCSNMSKFLSDEIKNKVKALRFDRYKIVCSVTIGQRKDQGMQVTSRCAWDDKLDDFASYTFQNENIFCTAVVFGIYNE